MAYIPPNPNGQATSANSAPVVLSTSQEAILQNISDLIDDTSVDADAIRIATEALNAKLPSATSFADAIASPTTTLIGAAQLSYNGATWDRLRGNTTSIAIADTGTKTASFNGATQTNHSCVGAYVWILCGTVSGTTPTLVTVLQWSPDDGTTFYDITSATTAVTTTGASIGYQVYPGVNGTWNVSTTASKVLISALPRTWRIRYVIAGTSPSFAISDVRVNYIK